MDTSQLCVFLCPRADLTVIVWGETTAIYKHKVPVVSAVTEENYDDCLRRLENTTDSTYRREIEKWWNKRM